MFNKKFLVALCYLLGIIFILTFLLHVTMYIWALVGKAPFEIYDVSKGLVSYYTLIAQLVSFIFYFIIAGTAAWIIKSSHVGKISVEKTIVERNIPEKMENVMTEKVVTKTTRAPRKKV